MSLERPLVRAPELPPAEWINTPTPVRLASLRGRVVLLDLWEFTCVNCLNTMPYLRAWHERYAAAGLVILGVHTPEFSFARARDQVEAAAGRLGIRWPVVLDNDQTIWTAFANRYWPTVYLIDSNGYLRYSHAGERGYQETEAAIQTLMKENNAALDLPEPMALIRAEDASGAVCYPTTPELHIDAIGNEPPPLDLPLLMEPPPVREDGRFYLQGAWQVDGDGLTLAGERGSIYLPYHAASVNAVLSPSPDPVTLALRLEQPVELEIEFGTGTLHPDDFGQDVYTKEDRAVFLVDVPRMYSLVRHTEVQHGELRLHVSGKGLTFYAFSFESCLDPDAHATAIALE